MNPIYLKPHTLKAIVSKFSADSSIELHEFLRQDVAVPLKSLLLSADKSDGLGPDRSRKVPPHANGTDSPGWTVKGPPHKHRYCSLSPASSPTAAEWTSILRKLQTTLFSSAAFRSWLRYATTLVPLSYAVETRRFRPGLDYTLAKATDNEARLDVILGLTPPVPANGRDNVQDWDDGNWGGWEVRLAVQDVSNFNSTH